MCQRHKCFTSQWCKEFFVIFDDFSKGSTAKNWLLKMKKTLLNPSLLNIMGLVTSQNNLNYLPHLRSVLHWLPKFCPRLEKRIGIDLPKWVNYQWPTSKFWQWSFAIHWVAQKWLSCIFLIYRKSNREDLRLHPWKNSKLVISSEIFGQYYSLQVVSIYLVCDK